MRKAKEFCSPDANGVWQHATVIPPLGRLPQEDCELEVNLNCLREKERKGDGVEVGRDRKRRWKGEDPGSLNSTQRERRGEGRQSG